MRRERSNIHAVNDLFNEMHRRNLSIEDVSEMSGVPVGTIQNWFYHSDPRALNLQTALHAVGLALTTQYIPTASTIIGDEDKEREKEREWERSKRVRR